MLVPHRQHTMHCILHTHLNIHRITHWMFHCFLSLKHVPHWENTLYYVQDADLNTLCITCFRLNCFFCLSVCLTENGLYNPDGHSCCWTALGPEPISHREHRNSCKHGDFSACHSHERSQGLGPFPVDWLYVWHGSFHNYPYYHNFKHLSPPPD